MESVVQAIHLPNGASCNTAYKRQPSDLEHTVTLLASVWSVIDTGLLQLFLSDHRIVCLAVSASKPFDKG